MKSLFHRNNKSTSAGRYQIDEQDTIPQGRVSQGSTRNHKAAADECDPAGSRSSVRLKNYFFWGAVRHFS